MSIKKFKRQKVQKAQDVTLSTIIYQEDVIPPTMYSSGLTIVDELMEPEYVLPFGYPTEQFFG